ILEDAGVTESSDLINPQEQAAKNRMEEERKKWSEQIEHQKQEQLALLKQIEEKRARLEADLLKIQMPQNLEEVKEKAKGEEGQPVQSSNSPLPDQQKEGENETEITAAIKAASPRQASHLQMIRSYQQRLLQQNR
ncbi:CE295 protein, partial [Nothoprocta ornata]|nr:CE295 protein [Nothoprocta pentlandii]NWX95696.1 CE295 protein [Nothoprocta ornata]